MDVLKNITGIDQVKPSNNIMIASLLLLSIALSSSVSVILIIVVSNKDRWLANLWPYQLKKS
ncbi:hypothetical protein WUBG_12315 [Wuchereria bancrofti]|uniref:Uncharacterized protein n=1 Tax=Wuchereria bancrofti TaxID=6293 RepID=J9E3P4_WUCBA|nr:hypothetical protein WUBG_12315 [Wuchereria bancrofti]